MGSAVLALGLILGTTAAQTQPVPKGRIFEVDSVRDGFSIFALIGVGILIDREKTTWAAQSACVREFEGRDRPPELGRDLGEEFCDPRQVNALDRIVTELNSPTARLLSDIGVASLMALPLAISAIDMGLGDYEEPGYRFGEDALVIGQTLGATLLATNAIKIMVRRPRPLTYNAGFTREVRFGGDAKLSFPSGHTSFSFAAASISAVMLAERHGASTLTYVGAAGAYLLAATVGYLRVVGGKHFITDVLAGAALGTALGLAIPLLHLEEQGGGDQGGVVATSMAPVFSLGGRW